MAKKFLQIRVTDEFKKRILEASKYNNQTITDYIREAIIARLMKDKK